MATGIMSTPIHMAATMPPVTTTVTATTSECRRCQQRAHQPNHYCFHSFLPYELWNRGFAYINFLASDIDKNANLGFFRLQPSGHATVVRTGAGVVLAEAETAVAAFRRCAVWRLTGCGFAW